MHPSAVVALALIAAPALAGCLDGGNPFFGPEEIEPQDYLTDDTYTEWLIEIDYVQGHRPTSQAINLLRNRMDDLVHKDSIRVTVGDALRTGQSGGVWSLEDILDASRDYQSTETGDGRVVTHVLYLDGRSSEDSGNSKVLGVAVSDHKTVALFHETIEETADGNFRFTTADIEEAVLVHEFGHILGLVDNGVPMVRPHSDGGHHSDNTGSVMHASIRSNNIVNILFGSIPTTFDNNDKADLCAAGGKC